jgi:DNA invertase Pin-like site-specific DNA recombinase
MVAEMELSFIKDRQRAGIEAAKARGIYKGRPVTFDHAKIIALRKEGSHGDRRRGRLQASFVDVASQGSWDVIIGVAGR